MTDSVDKFEEIESTPGTAQIAVTDHEQKQIRHAV